nr:hypothetical protein [Lachnospiraceae bacterium]
VYEPGLKHLSLGTLKDLLMVLSGQGTLGSFSRVYVTHISHSHKRTHEELEDFMLGWTEFPFKIHIAYDGMEIK